VPPNVTRPSATLLGMSFAITLSDEQWVYAPPVVSAGLTTINEGAAMKYFIDTHDRAKGSFPAEQVTAEQFEALYGQLDSALQAAGGLALGAHINLGEGKVFCLTAGADEAGISAAHDKIGLRYDSITEVHRVSGIDLH